MTAGPARPELQGEALNRAISAVYRLTGVTLGEGKQSMLQGRLRTRMKLLRIDGFEAYLDRVEKDAVEREAFIDAVTTHQTQFFRTPRVWQFLADSVLPAWQAAGGPPVQRLAWSAATSTGEEAYSLAMLFEEHRQAQEQAGRTFAYRIQATDISARVLRTAEQGHYDGTSAQQFQTAWPQRFLRFNAADAPAGAFHAGAALRRHLHFSPCNLLEPSWPAAHDLDLVLLRNVLIYFSAQDSRRLLVRLAERMRPGATLVIGESESLNGLDLPFQFIGPQIYRRLP